MDPFTADFLANLAAELSAPVIAVAARRLKEQWQGDAAGQALQRCLEAGVLGMVSRASLDEPDQAALLADIFRAFFGDPAVAKEVTRLIQVQPLSVADLEEQFEEAGYDPQTLPGLRFPTAVAAFEAAFLEAAAAEPALQPIIQVHQGWAQTDLQREMVALMRQMVAALQARPDRAVGIRAGQILAENVVSGVQIVYQWPVQPSPDTAARAAYLAWVMRERETLPLRAISAGKTSGKERPPELAQVYVALNTKTTLEADASRRGARLAETEEKAKPLSALAALVARRRMVLLGDPGSGKSTFVSHLAYCLAAHASQPAGDWLAHLPDWPAAESDTLPLLLVLRDFARWLPDPLPAKAHVHHLWDFLAATLRKEKLDPALPFLEQALVEGRALLLLDGLDEVTRPDQRRFVRDAVHAFAGRYARCRVLVTCRVLAYQPPDPDKEEPDLRLDGRAYPSFELAPFDDAQRDTFIHAWYGELKRQGHLPGLDAERLSRDLQQAIRRSDLRRVAGNPLLLTVMAMVHVEEGRLPDSRALLYNKTVDLLLLRWEETKDADEVPLLRRLLQEASRTDIDLKTRLAEAAFDAHTQAGTSGDGERVADIGEAYLCQKLSLLHKKDLGWGQRLLEVLKTRAGLLVERAPGQFAFPHRTFQEYLAGMHLASQPQTEFTAQALDWARRDLGWWPMALFAVEYLVYVNNRPLDPLPLVSRLCPEAPEESVEGWRLAWLAGEALLSLGPERAQDSEWGQILLARVQRRLAALLDGGRLPTRERAEAGKTLARLGDPRPGVGVVAPNGVKLPDIAWGKEVPAGRYTLGGDREAYESSEKEFVIAHPFRLARYPVTYAQFQCFADAPDFDDGRWWTGMPDNARELGEQAFPYANHPRERVSWYQAVAFCRWLTARLHAGTLPVDGISGDARQYVITLPHEYEWEAAARYPDGRSYPWGADFDAEKANTDEGKIGGTTAVGIYPAGRQPQLDLYDLSGNVWEWCRNKYENPDDDRVDAGGDGRALRGGSWFNNRYLARAADRYDGHPDSRYYYVGLRLVLARRPPSQVDH